MARIEKWMNRADHAVVHRVHYRLIMGEQGRALRRIRDISLAVDVMESERERPMLDWKSVDVVTDRNNLRKLLAWTSGNDEMFRIEKGTDAGWPYTYYDGVRKLRLVSPEYGGDGKTSPKDGNYATPVAACRMSRRGVEFRQ